MPPFNAASAVLPIVLQPTEPWIATLLAAPAATAPERILALFDACSATSPLSTSRLAPSTNACVLLPISLMVSAAPTATLEPSVAAPANEPMKDSSLASSVMLPALSVAPALLTAPCAPGTLLPTSTAVVLPMALYEALPTPVKLPVLPPMPALTARMSALSAAVSAMLPADVALSVASFTDTACVFLMVL
ncbi:hypothetical protein D3C81_654270 [compost metagenome]